MQEIDYTEQNNFYKKFNKKEEFNKKKRIYIYYRFFFYGLFYRKLYIKVLNYISSTLYVI